jgi:hypothetical protein
MSAPPEAISCVDCGGVARLIGYLPEDLEPGYPITYRCPECLERFDIVWEEDDDAPSSPTDRP